MAKVHDQTDKNGKLKQSEVTRNKKFKSVYEGEKKEEGKTPSFIELYRYTSTVDKILIVIAILTSLAEGGMASISPLIFRGLTNALISGQSQWDAGTFNDDEFYVAAMSAIYKYVGFGIGIFLLGLTMMMCWHSLCERQIHQIRKRYFKAVLRQNMGWYDVNQSGELTTIMSDGIDRIKDGLGDKMGVMISSFAAFIGGIVVAFFCSWQMTLLMLAFMPLIAGLISYLNRFVGSSVGQEERAYGRAGSVAEEVLFGVRTVISFNGQKKEVERYDGYLARAAEHGTRKQLIVACGVGAIFCTMFVAMAVAFWLGTKLVIAGSVTAGDVFGSFWGVLAGAIAVGRCVPQIGALMAARNSAATMFRIIDRVPEIDCQSEDGCKPEKLTGDICFENVNFCYPTRPNVQVLSNVSFNVTAGQSVALVGHSGCGKSTMVGLMLRFYEKMSGDVKIDGRPIEDFNVRWLRQHIGLVSQEPVLFGATIEENLKLGNENMTEEEMIRLCKMANAHNFIKELKEGYRTRIGDGGIQLSGGQKQRIAIARALASNPKILLLDEATSALDTESEQLVQYAIEKAKSGRTTITIAHRLSTIRNSDRIFVFDHGRIMEQGTHEQLMKMNGIYMKLVKAQEVAKAQKAEEAEDEKESKDGESQFEMQRWESSRLSSDSVRSGRFEIRRRSRRMSRAMSGTSNIEIELDEMKLESAEKKVNPSSIFTILKFARNEWLMLAIALIASILRGFVFPVFSLIYGSMFQALSQATDSEKLHGAVMNAIYFTLLGVGSGSVATVSGYMFGKVGEDLTRRMRKTLFAHILSQDGEYFDSYEHSTGKLAVRLASDASNVRAAIDQRLADVVQSVSAITAGIIVAFTFSYKMAPVGVGTAVGLMVIQTAIAQLLKTRSERDSKTAEEPSALATEAIEHHKTVQYLTRENYFYEKFCTMMRPVHRSSYFRGFLLAVTFGLHASFTFLNFACAYRYGLWLVLSRNASPFLVFQVIEALNAATMSMLAFGTYFPEYVRARFSAGIIFQMLSEKPRISASPGRGIQLALQGKVKVNNVEFAYPSNPKHRVLKGTSFEAEAGQTVALVGTSGCGKSTVIQLLERFYDPLSGSLSFDDKDLKQLDLFNVRSQMALVGQEPVLFNYSIRENIAYGLESVSMKQIEEAAKLANAHNFIKEMPEGYDTSVGEKGGRLSGGQKQRIAIARAVIRNPKILLLDEATSALDSESEKLVQEALDRARNGRTCIVIAHRLSSIQNSDMIVVMKAGKVIERGTHQELLQNEGLYWRLTKSQNLE
ncbi:hypothetical protein AB6A40_000801 [Gnathostoma spinigerum]|uniref:ABC-type xenobiotic transporter n=1 Tax=Gnathostoma spinigerum TaxID=75299 RepID=A0ABD6EC70_9BILA